MDDSDLETLARRAEDLADAARRAGELAICRHWLDIRTSGLQILALRRKGRVKRGEEEAHA